jgi:hypothetical protein
MSDTLQVIKQVHDMFHDAFNDLLVLTIAVIGTVGVVIPLVIQFIQRRSLEAESQLLLRKLRLDVEEIQKTLAAAIEAKVSEALSSINKHVDARLSEFDKRYARHLDAVKGGPSLVQGSVEYFRGKYASAHESYCAAALAFLQGQDEMNCQNALYNVHMTLNENLCENDFVENPNIEPRLQDLLAKLATYNDNGRYQNYIHDIQLALNKAKKRSKQASSKLHAPRH